MTNHFPGPYYTTITKRTKDPVIISEFIPPLAKRELENLIRKILGQNEDFVEKIKFLETRIHDLESIMPPDQIDVHNINRRIEILAQKIATLESNHSKKKIW